MKTLYIYSINLQKQYTNCHKSSLNILYHSFLAYLKHKRREQQGISDKAKKQLKEQKDNKTTLF